MTRITIRTGDGGVLGWFDPDTATEYREAREWDGSNHISVPTGQQGRHQALYRTSGGRWVLRHYSDWQGEMPSHEYITDGQAKDWLILNEHDAAVEDHFGAIEDERGPGAPVTVGGKPINVRLGDDLLAKVDQRAAEAGTSRADMIRQLVAQAVA